MKNQQVHAVPDTHQKALAVNLDATSFGSFAEIGAGQEVARWFLRVGAASGTVAKTISAYDKEVSDDLYGSGTRYVSKPRLEAMLQSEWKSLLQQLSDPGGRAKSTRLFAFANTIAARNFAGTNDCHGWIGVRFQDRPQGEPSDILVHVNLRDAANVLQQEAVGILGVNLLHALLNERTTADEIPARLFDNLTVDRIEIDQINVRGSAFGKCDMVALHMALARDGYAEAVTLMSDGQALAANEFLYKNAVIISPQASHSNEDFSAQAIAACMDEVRREVAGDADVKEVINLQLMIATPGDPRSVVAGTPVKRAALVTRHQPLHRATAFVRRYTQAPLRFALTLPALMRIFDEARYQHLEGRLLEGLARLFGSNVRVLAYPCARQELQQLLNSERVRGWEMNGSDPWVTADQLRPSPPLRHIYEYLLGTQFLIAVPANDSDGHPPSANSQ